MMKAIVLNDRHEASYFDVPEVSLRTQNDVKIKVRATGLCGSDIQRIRSADKLKSNILGHEFSGEIAEIGSLVDSFSVGDRVTGIPFKPCYSCPQCVDQMYALCPSLEALGKNLPGSFANYVVLPAESVRKIPDSLSFGVAALVDVFAASLHAYNQSGQPVDKSVLIIGDGSIGLSCLSIFNRFGNKVSVVGNTQAHLIDVLGGQYVSASAASELEASSFDVVVEAVGRSQSETLEQATRLVKPRGKILVEGVYSTGYFGVVPFRNLFCKEATLQGLNSYDLRGDCNEFDQALRLLSENAAAFSQIITHVLPLRDFGKALDVAANKYQTGAVKIILEP